MEWLEQYIKKSNDFFVYDWQGICNYIDKNLSGQSNDLFSEYIDKYWLDNLLACLDDGYSKEQLEHFLLVSKSDYLYKDKLLSFFKNIKNRILAQLPDVAKLDYHFPIILFDSLDDYYAYKATLYPKDGEYGLSGGFFHRYGCRHIAIPFQDLNELEIVVTHEMTHAALSHLDIPLWLDEGIAVQIENHLTSSFRPPFSKQKIQKHIEFWNENTVQEFWSGKSFFRSDEGQELSYELASYFVAALSEDYDTFKEFVLNAKSHDAGDSAAHKIFGGSLAALFAQIIGDGDWYPKISQFMD